MLSRNPEALGAGRGSSIRLFVYSSIRLFVYSSIRPHPLHTARLLPFPEGGRVRL